MLLLGLSVAFFALWHLLPVLPAVKAKVVARLGAAYGSVYGIVSVVTLVLIIIAWRAADFIAVYDPPENGRVITFALVLVAFICLGIFIFRGKLRLMLRLPLAIGVIFWGAGHLFSNGDMASIILFGGMMTYGAMHLALGMAGGYHPADEARGGHDTMSILTGICALWSDDPITYRADRRTGRKLGRVTPCLSKKPFAASPHHKLPPGRGGEPIVSLTAYHAHTASIADKYCDFLLVGDSLGMVMHGFESTVPVPLDLMIMHGKAVVRGSKRALIVVDMPFGSYEESPPVAFRNAARIMKETDCGAVKLEGGVHMAETIAYLVQRGIPVMAHIGLTPQSVNVLGGFKTQGRTKDQWAAIEADAKAVSAAGAFALVLEAMAAPLADRISAQVPIPAIGIGASAKCDGQILVMEDMLGLTPRVPKFVKEFGKVGKAIERAIKGYADEVKARSFPADEHMYEMKD